MNELQIARQVRYRLANRAWSGSATLIFPSGSVVVSQLPVESLISHLGRVPMAIVRIGSGVADPDHRQEPGLLQVRFAVAIVTKVTGDRRGEHSLIGAHRQSDTQSEGRGLLEVQEEVLDEIGIMNVKDGAGIGFVASSVPDPEVMDGDPSVLARTLVFESMVSSARGYDPVSGLTVTAAGGGDVDLAWSLPPDRFDRYSIVVRRASGSTAPSGPTAWSGVTLGSLLATSVTDDPGAGTHSYSVFAAYDDYVEVGGASREARRYSAAETRTVVAT